MPAIQPPRAVRVPGPDDIERALVVVREHLETSPLDRVADPAEPVLKLESWQPTGSFKVRGALSALAALEPGVGVVTSSAGNHGLGIAFAARALGRHATVVVPGNASRAKVDALRTFGAELVSVGTSYEQAEEHALELAARGARYVSPYNDAEVIAGQATIGVELGRQLDGPLTVVCGVGGGGLVSGLGLWASTRDDVRVVGVEAEASMAVSAAVRAGKRVPVEVRPTLADGLSGNLEDGSVTPDLVAKHVHQLVAVSEAELRAGLRHLVGVRGVVAEGAGAAPMAALLAGKVDVHGTVVAVVSGRNIALPTLAEVLAERD